MPWKKEKRKLNTNFEIKGNNPLQEWNDEIMEFVRLELITRFSLDKYFDDAYTDSEEVEVKDGFFVSRWNVLAYDELVASRPKDIFNIHELERIRKSNP